MKKNTKVHLLIVMSSILVTVIFSCIAGEIYIRLNKPYKTPDTEREASLQYEATLFSRNAFPQLEQNTHQQDGSLLTHINSRGYRSQDFEVPKPQGTIRIIFMGGSSAFDIFTPEEKSWVHLVEKNLHELGYKRVEVINAAVPTHATWDELGRLYSEIWMFEPDYIVFYEAWNDIKYFTWLNPEKSLLRGYRPSPITDPDNLLIKNPFIYYSGPIDRILCLSQLYVRLRWRYFALQLGEIGPEGLINPGNVNQNNLKDTYGEWGPRQYKLNLRLIANVSREIGATPIFLTQARLVSSNNSEEDKKRINYFYVKLTHAALLHAYEDCDKAIYEIADEEDVPMLDLSKMLSGQSDLFLDHVHTTPLGSENLAKATASFLADVLRKKGYVLEN